MKIVIIGNGKVGYHLAERLAKDGHDITIVDRNEVALIHSAEHLDVQCIKGHGASVNVLMNADVGESDLVIAVTNSDEVNMLCCLVAKNLGAKYTIARIRDSDYFAELELLKKELKLEMAINPEYTTAMEIYSLIRFPEAVDIETFYRGQIELAGFHVVKSDFLVGKTVSHVMKHLDVRTKVLFCTVQRGDSVIIPNGSFTFQENDKVYVIGDISGVSFFFKQLGRLMPKIKDVMIAGGGRIAYYLAKTLEREKIGVKIIEKNRNRCSHLSEELDHSLVICGDGTDQDLLELENLSHTGAFVALTDRDEDNLIISLYASQRGVSKVIAKNNRLKYAGISQKIGVNSVISPKVITASHILHFVRGLNDSQGSRMLALYQIAEQKADAMEFLVHHTTHHLNVPFKNLPLKSGVLIAVIVRNGTFIIPKGDSWLEQNDTIIVISREHTIYDLNDIFAAG